MKRALLASVGMLATTFAPLPLIVAPAQAANPTLADAQQVCNDLYVNTQADPSKWRAEVVDFHSESGPSTQVAGSERNINYRPDTGSTFAYAGFTDTRAPLSRTGGSPNMWGLMNFSQKIWDNTLYDTEADFTHTVTYYWTCHVEQSVNHPEWVEGTPGNGGQCPETGNGNIQTGGNGNGNNGCGNGNGGGTGTGPGNNNGNNQQNGGNGNGNNGCGNGNGGPDGTNENCGGGAGGGGTPGHYQDHYTWDFEADYTDNSAAGDDVDEGYSTIATALTLAGHVDAVNYTEYGSYQPGWRLLSCISPGKKGGTWTPKSYYTGGGCSTTTFNAAPTTYGTSFDSPPTASLPAN